MSYEDDDDMGRGDYRRWRRERELLMDDAVYGHPKEPTPVVEPCRPVAPLTTPAKPGSFYAGQALKQGCQDAYDNEMEARFGPGW